MMRAVLLGLALGTLVMSGPCAPAQAFRWVDDKGVVHYSDQVPPDEVKHRRTVLSRQGREIQVLEGAKSPEQLRKEQQLKELRSEQDRLLAEQHDRDVSLLRTYRSEDEMYLALQGKLNTLDGVIKITETNRQRQKDVLTGQEKRAADFELRGQAVPKSLLDAMEATRRQIAAYEDKIRSVEKEKADIAGNFTKDIARFKALMTQSPDLARHGGQQTLGSVNPSDYDDVLISAVACTVGIICDRAWELARSYVQAHGNGPLMVDTDKILRTPEPANDQDLGLTVTRIAGKTEDLLFLDIRCRSSSLGEELCAGPKARDLRAKFKTSIEAGLTAPDAGNAR